MFYVGYKRYPSFCFFVLIYLHVAFAGAAAASVFSVACPRIFPPSPFALAKLPGDFISLLSYSGYSMS
jgi:hypothetical protein